MLSRAAVRSVPASRSNTAILLNEQLTRLPSRLIVASAKNLQPLHKNTANLVLAYRAGMRYETSEQIGTVRLIKSIMSYGPMKMGSRTILLPTGSKIEPFASPDYLGVCVSVPRNQVKIALKFLESIAAFKDCDLNVPLSVLDSKGAPPMPNAIEHIGIAAFRNGSLGNPYRPNLHVARQKYTDDHLRHFASIRMVASQAILYGVNVDHEKLCAFGEKNVPESTVPVPHAPISPYLGGEWRKEAQNENAYVAIGGKGAAAGNVPALAVQAVLMTALGYCARQADGSVASNGLLAGIAERGNTIIECNSLDFEGVGIVHINVISSTSHVENVVKGVVRVLKSFKVDKLEEAKYHAKKGIQKLERKRPPMGAALERAKQILAGRGYYDVLAAIDNVTASQVEDAAVQFASNLSIAAYGNIANVPYRSQL